MNTEAHTAENDGPMKEAAGIMPEDVRRCVTVCTRAGIRIVVAPAEADSQILAMYRRGAIHAVASKDSDFLLHGAPLLVVGKVHGSGDYYGATAAATALGLSQEEVYVYGAIVGNDACPSGVPGAGHQRATQAIVAARAHDVNVVNYLRENCNCTGDVAGTIEKGLAYFREGIAWCAYYLSPTPACLEHGLQTKQGLRAHGDANILFKGVDLDAYRQGQLDPKNLADVITAPLNYSARQADAALVKKIMNARVTGARAVAEKLGVDVKKARLARAAQQKQEFRANRQQGQQAGAGASSAAAAIAGLGAEGAEEFDTEENEKPYAGKGKRSAAAAAALAAAAPVNQGGGGSFAPHTTLAESSTGCSPPHGSFISTASPLFSGSPSTTDSARESHTHSNSRHVRRKLQVECTDSNPGPASLNFGTASSTRLITDFFIARREPASQSQLTPTEVQASSASESPTEVQASSATASPESGSPIL